MTIYLHTREREKLHLLYLRLLLKAQEYIDGKKWKEGKVRSVFKPHFPELLAVSEALGE